MWSSRNNQLFVVIKKTVFLFLAINSLFLVCSCNDMGENTQQIEKNSQLSDITSDDNESYNEDMVNDVLFKTTKKVYSTSDSIIEYTIQNNGNNEVSFSPYSYTLEKKESDKWTKVPFDKEYEFLLLERVLEPGEVAVHTIDLRNEFNLPLEKGVYRITKEKFKSESFEIE